MEDWLPEDERKRWLIQTMASLRSAGASPVSGLVLPNGDFFPDHFDGSPSAVDRLCRRILKLAGLTDLSVQTRIVSDDGSKATSCSSGACEVVSTGAGTRRVEETADGWQLTVTEGEVGSATSLTTAFVRAVSHLFMAEAALYEDFAPGEAEPASDVCGIGLGFGALLCNGSYIYKKG